MEKSCILDLCYNIGGVIILNKDAAFFSCMFVATVSFLSSIYIFIVYGFTAGIITVLSGFFWVVLGFWYKYSLKK